MIIGIAVDDWKLPIFRKHLETEGYLYIEHKAMVNVTMIKVFCNSPEKLAPIIEKANKECAAIRCPSCED